MDDATIEWLAAEAASRWPIITSVPRLVMRRENIVYKVETSEGPHALRLHRRNYHSREALASELVWMDMLASHKFVVPRPALSANGALLEEVRVARGESQFASLLSWLPGEPFGKSYDPMRFAGSELMQVMTQIGAQLARLHVLSDQWTVPETFVRPRWDFEGLLGDAPFWGPFWTFSGCSSEDRAELMRVRERCKSDLAAYGKAGADFGLIHADLARENVLIHGGGCSFVDFDDSGFGYRLFDLSTALIKNIHEPDIDEQQEALLAGYRSVRPLRPQDISALPLFMVLRSLTYLGWVEQRFAEPNMEMKAARFLSDVKYLVRRHLGMF